MRTALSSTIVVAVLVVAACGGDGSTDTTLDSVDSSIEATTTITPGTSTTEPLETTIPEAPPQSYPSIAADLGVAEIEQLTPIDGQGRRPVLEWTAVTGAALYEVFLLTPAGDPYWGWETSDTSVPVGGWPQLEDTAAGPAVASGMTWSVAAMDVDGNLLAISPQRPISP